MSIFIFNSYFYRSGARVGHAPGQIVNVLKNVFFFYLMHFSAPEDKKKKKKTFVS
jgi:hypothetical protein